MSVATCGGSWINAVFDEIALEGLEGVTLSALWNLLSIRLQCSTPLPEKLQQQVWTLLLRSPDKLDFFELPEPRPLLAPYNRYADMDENVGLPMVRETYPFPRYAYTPVQDGGILGNCVDYKTRIRIEFDELRQLSLAQAIERWNEKLVVVASQAERFMALTPPNIMQPKDLSVQQYCIWEAIGRARYNGETTVGPLSLCCYCKDAGIMFYIKNTLLRQKLIAVQSYTEKHNNRMICSSLLMLPRFFRMYKNHMQMCIEKLFTELKSRESKHMLLSDIMDFFVGFNKSQIKRLMVMHAFRKVFETVQVCPTPSAGKTSKGVERKVTVIQLRNPAMTFIELYQQEGDEKEEKQSEFLNMQRAYVDMTPEAECNRAIARFGARGVSSFELARHVGISFLITRSIVKYLEREGMVKGYQVLEGKQHIVRYVTIAESAQVDINNEELNQTVQQLQCKEEPHVPTSAEIVLADLPEIIAKIRNYEYEMKNSVAEKRTQRQVQRKALFVSELDKNCILHATYLRACIQREERTKGYRESICRKSLFRLLNSMREAGILNIYEVTLHYQQHLRLYRLVTHPKIDMEHKLLHREVVRLKNNFYLLSEERRMRTVSKSKEQPKTLKQSATNTAEVSQVKKNSPKIQGPKLLLARVMHELLFYLLHELDKQQSPIEMNTELLQQWQSLEPSLAMREFHDEWLQKESYVLPYTREINWRTFIPPLPSYPNKPAGWLSFMDAIERMPLSIFIRMFRIERPMAEQLEPYLQHPVRQHYLVRHIAAETLGLVSRLQLQQTYISSLRLLNNMGLVQVTERQQGKDPLQRWVYFNRQTRILDTTTSENRYMRINAKREYGEHRFTFNKRDEVADYWSTLQHICIYTKLGFLKSRRRSEPINERPKPLSFTTIANVEEALERDNGTVPGDSLGAGGLNSGLFAHLHRHWSWVVSKVTPKGSAYRKQINMARLKPQKPKHQIKLRTRPRITHGTSRTDSSKYAPRDDLDRDALKNMRTLRVSWSPQEDRLLRLGRAAYIFLGVPAPTLGLFNVGAVCRDLIRYQLGICNKTTASCVRRLQFILKKKRDLPDVTNWTYILQTNPELAAIYNEGFLSALKREYQSRTELNQAAIVHLVHVMTKLEKLLKNGVGNPHSQFLLPDTLEEYNRQLRECSRLSDELQLNHTNPTTVAELQVHMVTAVLHSTLCCAKDKTLYNLQAFEIYKHFPEDVLNAAFNKARTDSLVVVMKRRDIHMIKRHVTGPAYLLSSKYKYRLTYLKLNYVIYDAYHAYAQKALGKLYTADQKVVSSACLQLTSPNIAQLLWMSEWLCSNYLSVNIELPANILTVDPTSMSIKGASAEDRILDHYSRIFDNAPQTEYAKRMESECSIRQESRVRFHPANITYKVPCSPYDLLSKLPYRALHFFCALDQLGETVQVRFARLTKREHFESIVMDVIECPFKCLMRNADYLNEVERVVQQQRDLLKQLAEDTLSQTKIHLSASGNNPLVVEAVNLLSLVQQLEAYWREREHAFEMKDLGKAFADCTLHKQTDWRTVCRQLVDYDASAWDAIYGTREFEPAMNKEERARPQDVFVVCLPTLQLRGANEANHKQAALPPFAAETERNRKAVLDKVLKETYWNYTEHSFETLRPQLLELDFDDQAMQHMEDILKYIKQHCLGVLATDLRRNFPLGQFLIRALHLLADHSLIKRVGVSSYMYVHKQHIRNWVVHTFHIKRLERERVQALVANTPMMPAAVSEKKRKSLETTSLESQECVQALVTTTAVSGEKRRALETTKLEPEEPSSSKVAKLLPEVADRISDGDSTNSGDESQAPKRRRRNTGKDIAESAPTTSIVTEMARDVIVIRPQPWIRVNGSLNRRVLDRWLGALLSECIAQMGCTVHHLCLRFTNMTPVDIMFLLELLADLGCLHLMEIEPQRVQVDSEYEECKEQRVTELYEPTLTYIVTHGNAVGLLSNFIGNKLYTAEFV